MKKQLLTVASLSLLICSCRNYSTNEVVKETYIHKYGVPTTADGWNQQGQDGKIVQLHKDGVTCTRTYSAGIPHGETLYTYPNSSTVQRSEQYDMGVLVSRQDNFFSGVPMLEEEYREGTLLKRTRWYEDGTPQAIENYERGLLLIGEYRTPLNVVESRIRDGEGTRPLRNNEGELTARDSFSHGEMIERVEFYPSGDPKCVTPYQKGEVHGTRLTFLHGGIPQTVEEWKNGVQDGVTTLFQNGEKCSEVTYVKGHREGVERRFRDGSELVEEVNWKSDMQHGKRTLFVDGQSKIEWYHRGELVSRPTFERLNPPR